MQEIYGDGDSDSEVIERVLNGRVNDFEILLKRYRSYLFRIVSRFLPPDMVPEITHEISIEIFRSLAAYRGDKTFKKWIAGIAIHRCHDYWRKHYRNRELSITSLTSEHRDVLESAVSDSAGDTYMNVESQREAREILDMAMSDLSLKERMVVTLVHLEGYSVKEAAEILGWSVINVKVRAFRSRQKMQKKIASLLEEEEIRSE